MGLLNLTKEEIKKLKNIHKYSRNNTLKQNRIKVILAYDSGKSKEEIRDFLLLDLKSIRRYINDFKAKRMDSIEEEDKRKDGNRQGRRLTKEQLQEIDEYLKENIISDAKEIQILVKKQYDIDYSISAIHDILHSLGYVYKQVTITPQKSDDKDQIEKQLAFEAAYEELTENIDKEKDSIYFFDAEHPTHNTKVGYAWVKKGETKEIEANSGRKRINLWGLYSPISAEILFDMEESINAQSVIHMFDKALEANQHKSGDIYIILDNARYNKSNIVQEALKKSKYSRIKLIFLPPYSPNLNLIERVWRFANIHVRNNKFYEKFTDFKKSIEEFFDQTVKQEHMKEKLKQFVSNKFHIPHRDLVTLDRSSVPAFEFNKFG